MSKIYITVVNKGTFESYFKRGEFARFVVDFYDIGNRTIVVYLELTESELQQILDENFEVAKFSY